MKKMILSILCFVFILFGLTGCGSTIGGVSNIEISDHDILVSIKEGTLTSKGATFIMENNSGRTLYYGEGYDLEIKQDDAWHEINVGPMSVHPILLKLNNHNSIELEIVWDHIYGVLESGEYRFLKSVSFENDLSENFYIGIEFTIE